MEESEWTELAHAVKVLSVFNDVKRKLFFISGFPHLIKKVRNGLEAKGFI